MAEAAKRVLPDAEVYVVGSAVRGDWVGSSDVDVLIVSGSLPEGMLKRAEIKVEVEDLTKLPAVHPFEIHWSRLEKPRRTSGGSGKTPSAST